MNYADARQRMVENQVRANKVLDPLVIAAMEDLPREAFTPDSFKDVAYVDDPIPLGGGRCQMEPMVLARLVEALKVQPTDMVLEIGCGAGYGAALLARLASTVVSLECDEVLAAKASKVLGKLGIDNVAVISGKLEDGYAKQAPYDVIFINGQVADVPLGITQQLAEGGRLVTVVGDGPIGRATLFTRTAGGQVSRRDLFDAAMPPLADFAENPVFAL